MVQIISREELKHLIDAKREYTLIDVRQPEELSYGLIPTAHNVPLPELNEALASSPDQFFAKYKFPKPQKNNLVIFNCRSGSRSNMATMIAEDNGYIKAKNYAGSVLDWAEIDPNVQRY